MVSTAATTDRGRGSRRRIVESAAALFYERGVSETGLNDIAAASNTGKGQLYHYFASKADLVSAVIAVQLERTLEAQRERVEGMTDLADLRAWTGEALGQHTGGGPIRCPLGALAVELADAYPALNTDVRDGFDQWTKLLEIGLSELQARGCIRTDRGADDLARVLLSAYEGGILLSGVAGTTRPLELALDAAVEYLITIR